ncbi:unnamed protein product [Calypogeia fissa]
MPGKKLARCMDLEGARAGGEERVGRELTALTELDRHEEVGIMRYWNWGRGGEKWRWLLPLPNISRTRRGKEDSEICTRSGRGRVGVAAEEAEELEH